MGSQELNQIWKELSDLLVALGLVTIWNQPLSIALKRHDFHGPWFAVCPSSTIKEGPISSQSSTNKQTNQQTHPQCNSLRLFFSLLLLPWLLQTPNLKLRLNHSEREDLAAHLTKANAMITVSPLANVPVTVTVLSSKRVLAPTKQLLVLTKQLFLSQVYFSKASCRNPFIKIYYHHGGS